MRQGGDGPEPGDAERRRGGARRRAAERSAEGEEDRRHRSEPEKAGADPEDVARTEHVDDAPRPEPGEEHAAEARRVHEVEGALGVARRELRFGERPERHRDHGEGHVRSDERGPGRARFAELPRGERDPEDERARRRGDDRHEERRRDAPPDREDERRAEGARGGRGEVGRGELGLRHLAQEESVPRREPGDERRREERVEDRDEERRLPVLGPEVEALPERFDEDANASRRSGAHAAPTLPLKTWISRFRRTPPLTRSNPR